MHKCKTSGSDSTPVRKATIIDTLQRKTLTAAIDALIRQSSAEMVAVAFHDLATGDEVMIRAEERVHPASTIKLAVLAEAFHQAQQGGVRLDERIPLNYTFTSNGPGAPPFTLTTDLDSEKTLYDRPGDSETIRELCRLMIVRSSNLATNLLYDRLGVDAVNAYMREVGAGDLLLRNHLQDIKAFQTGETNLANARALADLLTRLAEKRLVSEAASEEMIDILRGQEFKEGIPAGLPPHTPVAHKTGSFTRIYHDAGIVYPPGDRPPYVLVVLTKGIADITEVQKLVAEISERIYTAAIAL
ncbi:MAG: serine hydrolase [Akkermansiaceae bacterium]|nr:serine hydrolase [Armatimonadota bacterium]